MAGYSTGNNSGADYRVIKYAQDDLTANNNAQIQSNSMADFILSQNSPNPFITETKISFILQNKNSNYTDVKLWIEDASGKKLNTLMDKKLSNGTYEVNWNAE